jgi:transcriptional regulator with PAS, ATPase and Fis domain
LFGYEKGAFTDARQQKRGILEMATGGTIFLDEIGEMPVVIQAKMLRVLEEHTFRRLGGVHDIQVDLRVVAATNRRLVDAIHQGRFRQDLYYRLNVIQVVLPPLRDRKDDILPLVQFFIGNFNPRFRRNIQGLTTPAAEALLQYDWPGNIRELRNTVERAMVLEESEWIQPSSLLLEVEQFDESIAEPPATAASIAAKVVETPAFGSTLEEAERNMVVQALQKAGGNQTKAAALLGISRDTMRYKLKKFNLRPQPE